MEDILVHIWEQGEPDHCRRNKMYLEGIYGLLLNLEENEAENVWKRACGRQMFENLMLRENIGQEMDAIVDYVGEIGSDE